MKAGRETQLYNQGYADGFDDAVKSELEAIMPKIKDVKEKIFPKDDPDYWDKLLHQYAGMAMQGLLSNSLFFKDVDKVTNGKPEDMMTTIAKSFATALVEKLKESKV